MGPTADLLPSGRSERQASGVSAGLTALVLVSTIRLLAVGLDIPVELSSGRPARGLLALGCTSILVAAHFAARARVVRTRHAQLVTLAADVAVAAAVWSLAGAGLPLAYHLFGTAMLATAVLGIPGVGVAAGLGIGFGLLLVASPDNVPVQLQVSAPVPFLLVAVLVAAVRHVLQEQQRLRVALRATTAQLAAAEERARLARDLHDSVGKTLTGITLSASGLRSLIAGPASAAPDAEQIVSDIEASADRAVVDLRAVIAGLRTEGDPSLGTALDRLVTSWTATSLVPTEVDVPVDLELPAVTRDALVAIAGECLYNAGRHASARKVWVSVARSGADVSLTVRDDGRGFTVPDCLDDLTRGLHFGLVGMLERARLAGGTLQVTSGTAGTCVQAVVPAHRIAEVAR